MTAKSTTVLWTKPEKHGGSEINNYVVEMKDSSDIKWRVVKDKVRDTSCDVTGLKESGAYEFRMTAENKVGQSSPSNSSQPVKYGR